MKACFVLLILIITCGCDTDPDKVPQEPKYEKPPPPPLSAEDQRLCDSLKAIAYNGINKGEMTIVFNDTITDWAFHQLFVYVLKNRLGFNYLRLYDLGTLQYKYCVQPIMDSAIAAKYGNNAKDSLINIAYNMASTERGIPSLHIADVVLLSKIPDSEPCGISYNVARANVRIQRSTDTKLSLGDTVTFFIECPGDYFHDLWAKGKEYTFSYITDHDLKNVNFINHLQKAYPVAGSVIHVKEH